VTPLSSRQVNASQFAQWVSVSLIILLHFIAFGCAQKRKIAPPVTRIGKSQLGGTTSAP